MKGQSFLVFGLFATLAFAGCTDEPADVDSSDDVMNGSEVQAAENVTLTFGPHSGLATERPADWEASLEAPPEWVLGEWWRIEITDGFTGETREVTRIAAGKEGQDLLVGMPIEDFNDEVMVLHFPCFGLVRASSLGCEAHDYLFEPLSFPLNEGDSWDSQWQAPNTLTHTVASVDADAMTAEVQMSGATAGTYIYDANIGAITEFNVPGYEIYRVIDHGFDYEGVVRVPYSHDMTIYHGRVGPGVTLQQSEGALQGLGLCVPGANGISTCTDVAAPIETFNIPESGPSGVVYDRASFALIAIDLSPAAGGIANGLLGATTGTSVPIPAITAGYYNIKATAPDGTTYELNAMAGDPAINLEGFSNDAPAGDWDLEIITGGPGLVFIEGITYTTFDVSLPSGCILVEEDIHDHGGECGGHVHNIE